jgi:hypothetical protein
MTRDVSVEREDIEMAPLGEGGEMRADDGVSPFALQANCNQTTKWQIMLNSPYY